eukprot:351091-Chlamydomonas_euryale.AAC.5
MGGNQGIWARTGLLSLSMCAATMLKRSNWHSSERAAIAFRNSAMPSLRAPGALARTNARSTDGWSRTPVCGEC